MGIEVFFAVSQILYFAAVVAALAFALSRWSRYPRASKYLVASLGITLFAAIATMVFQVVMARAVSAADFAYYSAGVSVVGGLIRCVTLGLIVMAVYVGRNEVSSQSGSPADSNAKMDHGNPYATPR